MKATMRRVAGKVAGAVHEMNEAQRLMLALRTGTDQHVDAGPATYEEFLARSSGMLMHEPSARKRTRRARLG